MARPRPTIPISLRKHDWFFIVSFVAFAAVALTFDLLIAVGQVPSPEGNVFMRWFYGYAARADPMALEGHAFIRIQDGISAFVYAPLYAWLVYAFSVGNNRARLPTVIWAGTMITNVAVYVGAELLPGYGGESMWMFLLPQIPYVVVPVAGVVRMRYALPFGTGNPLDPVLPQDDPEPQERSEALERRRRRFTYATEGNLLAPISVSGKFPFFGGWQYNLRWAIPYLPQLIVTRSNTLWKRFKYWLAQRRGRFDKFRAYLGLYSRRLPAPDLVHTFSRDDQFARERIDGANPLILERVSSIADLHTRFAAATSEVFERVMGPGPTLAEEVAAGNVFLLDYKLLQDVLDPPPPDLADTHPPESRTDSRWRVKYLPTSLVLLCQRPGKYELCDLVPVAIQIDRAPGSPIYTPLDGDRWDLAKAYAQCADLNHQVMSSHLARNHYFAEAFAVSTPRHLAVEHPIYVLLEPHLAYTLAVNRAATSLLSKRGKVFDQIYAGTLAQTRGILQQTHAELGFRDLALERDLDRRGVGTEPAEYPYREDGRDHWAIVHEFVDAYVRLFYTSDDVVVADTELHGWVTELHSPSGGGLRNLIEDERLTTVEQLVELLGQFVFMAGPGHAAIHYPQKEYLSLVAAFPAAAYKEPPLPGGEELTPAWLLEMMPPIKYAAIQFDTNHIGDFRLDVFGHYDAYALGSMAKARPIIASMQRKLIELERVIEKRNETRARPYPYLLPSKIPNSINI